jgi:hypothetical protein
MTFGMTVKISKGGQGDKEVRGQCRYVSIMQDVLSEKRTELGGINGIFIVRCSQR